MPSQKTHPDLNRSNWANGEILVISTDIEGEWIQVEDPSIEVDLEQSI